MDGVILPIPCVCLYQRPSKASSSRFMGQNMGQGGFAGTVQAFVPLEMLDAFRTGIDSALGEGACLVLSIRPQGGVEAFAK